MAQLCRMKYFFVKGRSSSFFLDGGIDIFKGVLGMWFTFGIRVPGGARSSKRSGLLMGRMRTEEQSGVAGVFEGKSSVSCQMCGKKFRTLNVQVILAR